MLLVVLLLLNVLPCCATRISELLACASCINDAVELRAETDDGNGLADVDDITLLL